MPDQSEATPGYGRVPARTSIPPVFEAFEIQDLNQGSAP